MPRPLLVSLLILLAPLAAFADETDAGGDESGFVSIFNGKNLDGWEGRKRSFKVEDGMLVSTRRGAGFFCTAKEYGDFVLRFEYKLSPGANNGVGIRAPIGGRASVDGVEVQLLDDTAKKFRRTRAVSCNGAIYGIYPPKRGFLKPPPEWNAMEIRAVGHNIRVTLNGTVITEVDLSTLGPRDIRGTPVTGLLNLRGHVGFCAHKCRVEFRNIRIKEL